MKYRVAFEMGGGKYFTEWFDTFTEAMTFVDKATQGSDVFPLWIEDEENEVVV